MYKTWVPEALKAGVVRVEYKFKLNDENFLRLVECMPNADPPVMEMLKV